MRYMVEKNYVDVVGTIWLPPVTASYRYMLSHYDLENIGLFTRKNVAYWLQAHAGDFRRIQDFYATAGDIEIPWETEEGECAYADTLEQEE